MNLRAVASLRFSNQLITGSTATSVGSVVARLTAIQAQDFRGALWSVGLRLPGSTVAQVEHAIADREIVRTWPMRGTLHFVAAPDVRWMLQLLGPRMIKSSAGRMRQLEIDDAMLSRSRKLITKAMRDGRQLTRPEIYALLARARISPEKQRGIHIISRLAHEGLLCFAPDKGKQAAFALLDEWIPESRTLDGDEALAELGVRYFRGHGPATDRDLAWWAGLSLGGARKAALLAASSLAEEIVDGVTHHVAREAVSATSSPRTVHLLPGFDELLLGYSDRRAVLDPVHAQTILPGKNGMFLPTIVAGGRVVGTWRSRADRGKIIVDALPFARLSARDDRAMAATAKRYERFLTGTTNRS